MLAEFFTPLVRDLDECWLWPGKRTRDGYGRCSLSKYGDERAHRVAYALWYAEAPGDLHVCHTCDTPLCVNPTHLWLGTSRDNNIDCVIKGRRPKLFGTKNGMHLRGDRITGNKNHMYGCVGALNPMYGRQHTELAKQKMREAQLRQLEKNGPRRWTLEQREAVSAYAASRVGAANAFFGRTHSEATKRKMREAWARRKARV